MNVLSLFDGMSCGRIALDRLGIPVDKYYASEIDKFAIQVSEANYPDIIRLGDVCDVKAEDLPKIDLLIAGSPCQGFSFAGKQLAFDDPRSALFFEFVRLLKECKPKYFLLENVRMKKEYLQVISEQVSACYPEIPFGIEPTMICSSLVSAQSRKRYYWTNIPNVTQPKQKGIVLRDILETRVNQDRLSDMNTQDDSSHSPIQVGIAVDVKGFDIQKRVYSLDGKSPTIMAAAGTGGGRVPKIETHDTPKQVGNVLTQDEVYWRKLTPLECERLQTVPDNYTDHVSNSQRFKMLGNGWTIEVIKHIFKNMEKE